MTNNVYAGIDIGGTTIKLAFITKKGDIVAKWEIATNRTERGKYITQDIARTVKEKAAELKIDYKSIKAGGVGAPGYIDVENGVIIEAVNLGWKDYHIKTELETLLTIPIVVDNDANLAAAGEKWKGAGAGADDLVAITLGTGVGGGIIAGGKIIHGESGLAGEIGHVTAVKEDGEPCNCGKKGCLETVASATGIARLGMKAIQESIEHDGYLQKQFLIEDTLTAKDVFDGAKNEDETALQVVKTATDHLGFALANLANSLNPQTIVIGGGVSKAGTFLLDFVSDSFKKYAIPLVGRETDINIATLGNDAGVIGAVWLAKETYDNE
ncbi:ROK family glucokinase [Salipaludibacillus sp. LMS25]|uniref:ROK family glucokinase n=1 Tax=Salipaludibacillus sp. LMS25 TaxID=2924031 RepID=UPI0020D159EC|nr:ROK family glucokinase [Salipaludibacillus sp. LMS25]UTR14440.1 ROK family glucokinase [Salipaludibacillus sp. LMS25]